MHLTIDRLDLKKEFENTNCSQTKFDHFLPEVQAAIAVVGSAQFREFDGRSYNAIYPPQKGETK